MKRKLFLLLAGGVFAASVVCSFGQGTVNFQNGGPGVNAPVRDWPPPDGVLLSGSNFRADLYWAFGTVTDSTALQSAGFFTAFGTGASAGYFFGGVQLIPGTSSAGGQVVTVQIRAWDSSSIGGTTWATCVGPKGAGNLFQVTLGGGTTPPPNFTAAQPFYFPIVPEPSSLALIMLGAGIMLLWRRRIGGAYET